MKMIKYAFLPVFILLLLTDIHSAVASDLTVLSFDNPMVAFIGLTFLVLEFILPTKGLLGLIGMIFFVVGTFALADHPDKDLQLSWPSIIGLNVTVIGLFLISLYITIKGYWRKPNDSEPLLGQTARVIEWNEDQRRVEIAGSIWQAASDRNFQPGDHVIVTVRDNLTLIVTGETP